MQRVPSDPFRFSTNTEIEARLLKDGFQWDGQIGGNCPVLVEFKIDGLHGYFRARGTHWSFVVAIEGVVDPANADEELFKIESYFDEWPKAGWMPVLKALEYIEVSLAAYRAVQLIKS